jgi:hypothetical protein
MEENMTQFERMRPIIVAIILAFLSACVYQQHGTRFDANAVNELQPGVSTKEDAIAKLGKPSSVTTKADGTQLLQWQYVYGTAIGTGGGAHAAIIFGPDGRMIRVHHLSKQ